MEHAQESFQGGSQPPSDKRSKPAIKRIAKKPKLKKAAEEEVVKPNLKEGKTSSIIISNSTSPDAETADTNSNMDSSGSKENHISEGGGADLRRSPSNNNNFDESECELDNNELSSLSEGAEELSSSSEDDENINPIADDEIIEKMVNDIINNRNRPDKHVLSFIERMQFPKIYIGPITPNQMKAVNWRIRAKGEMDYYQKSLFDYANRILQHPTGLMKAQSIKQATKRTYSYTIARYLEFMAKRKIEAAQFTIDGVLMMECMREYVDERIKSGFSGNLRHTIEASQLGMRFFKHCIALYECRDMTDSKEARAEVNRMRIIPNLNYLIDFAKQTQMLHHEIAIENFHDKNRHEYTNEVYTIDNLKAMMVNMYNLTGKQGKKNIYDGVNAILEILTGHHLLYRGENKREAEISDLSFKLRDSARGKVPILGFTHSRAKTISGEKKPHSMGCCRNKDVEICLVTGIAMSLWYRFDFEDDYGPLAGKNRPDFIDKTKWYRIKILFADSARSRNNESISYKYEASLVNLCLRSVNLYFTEKTHLGRKMASRIADANEVEVSQIERAGNWERSIMDGVYLTSYPLSFIFTSGGFAAEEPYDCIREIDPPESLQKQIFPWLDPVLETVEARDNESGWVGQNMQDNSGDRASSRFLQMLKTFRKVILQDLTDLMDRAPDSIFAKHPITKDPEFIRFKEKVKRAQEELGFSQGMEEKRTLANILAPTFVKKVDTVKMQLLNIHSSLWKRMESISKDQESILRREKYDIINQIKSGVADQLREVINDRYQVDDSRVHSAFFRMDELSQRLLAMEKAVKDMTAKQDKVLTLCDGMVQQLKSAAKEMEHTSQRVRIICNRICGPHAEFVDPIVTSNVGDPVDQSGGQDNEEGSRPNSANALTDAVPTLKMSKKTDTVMKLLEEWYISKGDVISVHNRDTLFGHKWRASCSIYKRRKAIIAFIETYVKSEEEFVNITREELGLLIEGYRIRNGLKLNALSSRCQNAVSKREIAEELQQIWDQRAQEPPDAEEGD